MASDLPKVTHPGSGGQNTTQGVHLCPTMPSGRRLGSLRILYIGKGSQSRSPFSPSPSPPESTALVHPQATGSFLVHL